MSWVFWCGWLLWVSDFHHWCPGLIMKTYGAQCHSVSRKKKNCYHWLLKLLFTSCQIFIPGHRQFHIRTTNYTVKVLIAITPQGSACFLSKAWGGRTSDKFENDNCGILKKILPGDFSFSRPWFYHTGKSHVLSYPIAHFQHSLQEKSSLTGWMLSEEGVFLVWGFTPT